MAASERRRFSNASLVRFGSAKHCHEAEETASPLREEKLAVRKRGGRKQALGARRLIARPSRANESSHRAKRGLYPCLRLGQEQPTVALSKDLVPIGAFSLT